MSNVEISLKEAKTLFDKLVLSFKHCYQNSFHKEQCKDITMENASSTFFRKLALDSKDDLMLEDLNLSKNTLIKFFQNKDKRSFNVKTKIKINRLITFYDQHIYNEKDKIFSKIGVNTITEKEEKAENNYIEPEIDYFTEFSVFNYVAVLSRFGLSIPISLIEKLVSVEWELQKLVVLKKNNNLGIGSFLNKKNNSFYLKLNSKGFEKAQSIEFDDALIFNILEFCDTNIIAEKYLFNKLTIKKRYFLLLFKDFSYDLQYLIVSDKFPSSFKKALLYRLRGFYFANLDDYKEMHESFKNCIKLLKLDNSEESSSFYINWADSEKKFKKEEVVESIHKEALLDLPLPKNLNRTIRLQLALFYWSKQEYDKALELWQEMDYFLLKEDRFYKIFEEKIIKFIKSNPSKATMLQNFAFKLISVSERDGYENISNDLLKNITSLISNNFHFSKALFYYYLKKESDPDKALNIIKSIENEIWVRKSEIIILYVEYYLSQSSYELATWYLERNLENNNEITNYEKLYHKLANVFAKNESWEQANYYYQKVGEKYTKTNFWYAITLIKLNFKNFDSRIVKIFQNYFIKYPKHQNTKALGSYITYCLKHDKFKSASKYIINQIDKINSDINYGDYFISFLYQQQLRLTINHEQSEDLLEKALKFSTTTFQEAIVYSSYGKHLMYRGEDKSINTSNYDLREAIEYFKISYRLKSDDYVIYDIARCYFHVENYRDCIATLHKIKHNSLYLEVTYLKLRALFHLKNFKVIRGLVDVINNEQIKGFGCFYLAQNTRKNREIRNFYFEEAIKLNSNYKIKLEYAIYCFPKNKKKSHNLFDEVKSIFNENEDKQIELQREYSKRVSVYIEKAYASSLKKIKIDIKKLKAPSPRIKYGINNLIKKYPLDIRIQKLRFEYFFKIEKFFNCEKVLSELIADNLILTDTVDMFIKLAEKYFEYSQYFNFKKPPNRSRQIEALSKAFEYMEYVLKIDNSQSNILLYSLIPYKQGNLRKHRNIVKFYRKELKKNEEEKFQNLINHQKRRVKIFLWSTRPNDYFDKLNFYRKQEKHVATIIGDSKHPYHSDAIKILKSIVADSKFHKENNFYILGNITTRLGHYYYYHEQNYKLSFKYMSKVYKYKNGDIPFIRGFLKSLDKIAIDVKMYEYGIKICEFFLEENQIPTVYRYYGNWLKELGRYKESYCSYSKALDLFTEEYFRKMIYNNIVQLCYQSLIVSKQYFDDVDIIKEIANDSFDNIINIDSDYEYRDSTFKLLMEINKSK